MRLACTQTRKSEKIVRQPLKNLLRLPLNNDFTFFAVKTAKNN